MPAVLGAYYRAKLPETPRFTAQVVGDLAQAQIDIATVMHDTVVQNGKEPLIASIPRYNNNSNKGITFSYIYFA